MLARSSLKIADEKPPQERSARLKDRRSWHGIACASQLAHTTATRGNATSPQTIPKPLRRRRATLRAIRWRPMRWKLRRIAHAPRQAVARGQSEGSGQTRLHFGLYVRDEAQLHTTEDRPNAQSASRYRRHDVRHPQSNIFVSEKHFQPEVSDAGKRKYLTGVNMD